MIEKKDKEAGYIEFNQPEEVPDVRPITEKELNQKPQQVKPVGVILFPHIIQRR